MNLLSVAIASIVFYTWFVMIAILRTGKIELLGSFYNNDVVQSKSYSFFGGYLIGLSAWIDDSLLNNEFGSDLSLGKYTFAGLFQLLGISNREAGLLGEFQTFSDFNSNIYTFFRFIIMDYGLLGSTLVFLILGFVFSLAYHFARKKKFIFSLPLSMFYSMVLWSHTASLFVYNTVLLSFVLFFAYLSVFLTRKLVS
jgi:oligosaccharide repeat unit polymerase